MGEQELIRPRDARTIKAQLVKEAETEYGRGWRHLSEHQQEAEIALRFVSWIMCQRSDQFHDAQSVWVGGAVPRWSELSIENLRKGVQQ